MFRRRFAHSPLLWLLASHPAAFAARRAVDDEDDVDDDARLFLALDAEAAEEEAPLVPEPVAVDRFLQLRTVRRQRLPGAVPARRADSRS